MKAVLLSIRPNWCKLIWSGMKTIEVRKNRPNLKTPFKVYIYCTGAEFWDMVFPRTGLKRMSNRVIGTFVCDEIYKIDRDSIGFNFTAPSLSLPVYTLPENNDEERNVKREELITCLTDAELSKYLGIHPGYGWHISDLKIYDKPKALSSFSKHGFSSLFGLNICGNDSCEYYRSSGNHIVPPTCAVDGCCLKRPPQSWCYVEVGE